PRHHRDLSVCRCDGFRRMGLAVKYRHVAECAARPEYLQDLLAAAGRVEDRADAATEHDTETVPPTSLPQHHVATVVVAPTKRPHEFFQAALRQCAEIRARPKHLARGVDVHSSSLVPLRDGANASPCCVTQVADHILLTTVSS